MTSRSTAMLALVAALSISATAANAQPTPAIGLYDPLVRAEDYPRQSLRLQEQGTVGVAFTVNTDGTVTECSVATSSGKPRLDEAACAMVIRRWRYKPATDNGMPVEQDTTANIIFQLRRATTPNDLARGQAAARRGDYAVAITLWTPLAQQGNPAARSGSACCMRTAKALRRITSRRRDGTGSPRRKVSSSRKSVSPSCMKAAAAYPRTRSRPSCGSRSHRSRQTMSGLRPSKIMSG